MTLKAGSGDLVAVKHGSDDVLAVYVGDELVWAVPPVLTYRDAAVSGSDTNSYTFSGRAIGTAGSKRHVVVCVSGSRSSGSAADAIPTAVTVGGISATKLEESAGTPSSIPTGSSVWVALVPTGTTADVVATFANTNRRCGIVLFSLDYITGTPADSDATAVAGSNDISGFAATVPTVGLIFVTNADNGGINAFTFSGTGVTEVADAGVEGGQAMGAATLGPSSTSLGVASGNDNGMWACYVAW